MIEWIKDKFSTLVSVCFILFIVLFTVLGGFLGFGISSASKLLSYSHSISSEQIIGAVIGGAIGLCLGLLFGIMIFGFMATVIDISETENGILLKLVSFQNDTEKNLKKLTDTENDILNSISDIKYKMNKKGNDSTVVSKQSEETKTEQSEPAEKEEEEYIIVRRNGRLFAYKDDNLFCTKCHAFIDSEMKSMCPNCGASLME